MAHLTRLALTAAMLLSPTLANAQQGPGWFVPPAGGGGQPAAPAPRPAAPPARPPAPRPVPAPAVQVTPPPQAAPANDPPLQVQLPPVPDLPALIPGTPPPAAVIGVLGVPDIMRASSAAQQVEKTIGERREKLNEDAQKEQTAWRDLQQALANQRTGLSADQVRTKERELQERITNSQRQLRDRNRFIQESAQVGLAQIERTLIGVIRQVAESRGMNLVLRREQVALNINEFDITEQVVEQMNKVMPGVMLPPDGVSPVAFLAPGGPGGVPAVSAAPSATPASVPPGAPAPGTGGPRR